MANAGGDAKRSFWLHQLAEYFLGLGLVATGVQSTTPLVPTLAGALVVINAAMVDGPFGAFRAVSRATHRWLDIAMVVIVGVLGALPFLEIDAATRVIMIGIAAVMAMLVWQTNYARKRPPAEPGTRTTEMAGAAGRNAATIVNAIRNRRPR